MGAMTMVYAVENAAVVSSVKPGDRITATVYDGDFQLLHAVVIEK